MKIRFASLVLAALAVSHLSAGAEPNDLGPFGTQDRVSPERMHAYRLQRMARVLELDETQTSQWQALVEDHFETARLHHESLAVLTDEFRSLADEPDPDLTQLGQLALDIHRQRQAVQESRQQLLVDLESVLDAEQRERFEALEEAGDMLAPQRGRHRPHGPRSKQSDSD